MNQTRRSFFGLVGGSAAGLALPSMFTTARAADGFLVLTAGRSRHALAESETVSELWTYNGSLPGPEIRVRRGERVRVRLVNELDVPTSIHWHGIRIANAMDGVTGLTQDPVPPGETFEYDFVAPDAGTYWYHAHTRSWNQVARGLYGPLIVEEPAGPFDRANDLTLVLDDWRLDENDVLDVASIGSLRDWSHAGRLGNWLTVNGRSRPDFSLRGGEPGRIRLINASNARILEIDPNRIGARVLAYDGQPLPDPLTVNGRSLPIGPAQRVDLVVMPEAGEDFVLEEMSQDQPLPFARFSVKDNGTQAGSIPALPSNDLPEPDLGAANIVQLVMTGGAMGRLDDIVYEGRKQEREDFRRTGQVWAFNGVANRTETPLFSVKRGQSVVVEMLNDTAWPHAIHTHGHHFRVLAGEGGSPDEVGAWRDTVLIDPRQSARIGFVADNPGKWLLHCHMLEHAAAGMNTWFEVL